jgi:hypothetical protein
MSVPGERRLIVVLSGLLAALLVLNATGLCAAIFAHTAAHRCCSTMKAPVRAGSMPRCCVTSDAPVIPISPSAPDLSHDSDEAAATPATVEAADAQPVVAPHLVLARSHRFLTIHQLLI